MSCNYVWFSTALRFVFSTHVELIQRADDDNNSNKIVQGIYGLPFEIELPSSLPSSTFVKSGKRGSPSNCNLEVRAITTHGGLNFCHLFPTTKKTYELWNTIDLTHHAKLLDFPFRLLFQYKLYVMDKLQPTKDDFPAITERLFVVSASQLPHNEIVPIVIPPTNVTLKGVGGTLINRGTLSLGARIENSQIGRGEKLVISLACRNIDATADISRIHVKLVEHISWSIEKSSMNKSRYRFCGRRQRARSVSPPLGPSDAGSSNDDEGASKAIAATVPNKDNNGKSRIKEEYSTDMNTNGDDEGSSRSTAIHEHERVLVELPDVTFPGFVKEKRNGQSSSPSQPQVIVDLSHAEMYEDLKSKKNAVSLIVPLDARDTYVGHLLAVSHSIQITVHMDSNYTKDLPSILTIPLRIGAPPEIQEAKAIAINYGDFAGMH